MLYTEKIYPKPYGEFSKTYGNLLLTDLLLEGANARINLKSISAVT